MKFINYKLSKDLSNIKDRITQFEKGVVGGFSIEIEEVIDKNLQTYCYHSFLYKNEKQRDSDFEILEKLLV